MDRQTDFQKTTVFKDWCFYVFGCRARCVFPSCECVGGGCHTQCQASLVCDAALQDEKFSRIQVTGDSAVFWILFYFSYKQMGVCYLAFKNSL